MESIGPHLGQVPFQAHIELLQFFLAHRDDIVERIQGVLNAQRKPIEYLQDGSLLSRHFEDCFFIWGHPQPIAPERSIGRSALGQWIQAS